MTVWGIACKGSWQCRAVQESLDRVNSALAVGDSSQICPQIGPQLDPNRSQNRSPNRPYMGPN